MTDSAEAAAGGVADTLGGTLAQDRQKPWPGAKVRYYALAVLTIAYAASFIDRTIMSMQIDPIKRALWTSATPRSAC